MGEGDMVIFEDMPGYGQVTLSFKNNMPELSLSWDQTRKKRLKNQNKYSTESPASI